MIPHPLTGDVLTLENKAAIRASIRHILESKPFEIPHQANLLGLDDMVFITRDHIIDGEIKTRLKYTLEKFERRIRTTEIELGDNGPRTLIINIKYDILDLNDNDEITFVISRTN